MFQSAKSRESGFGTFAFRLVIPGEWVCLKALAANVKASWTSTAWLSCITSFKVVVEAYGIACLIRAWVGPKSERAHLLSSSFLFLCPCLSLSDCHRTARLLKTTSMKIPDWVSPLEGGKMNSKLEMSNLSSGNSPALLRRMSDPASANFAQTC